MKIRVSVFSLMMVMICASCKQKMTTEDYTQRENEELSAYCTNDIRAAEKTILDHLKTIPEYENDHVEGIDFDAAKALDHERLFLIYRKTHETKKMEFEFQQSMDYMAQSRHNAGETPPPSITYDEFARELDMREQKANVGWKTNVISSLSP
jgi:hypothetical protein